MGIKYQKFLSNNFFLLVLLFAVIVVVFLSYNRFIVRHDYIVGYEGVCDPITEKCFVGVDDTSGKEYYYSKVRKYAPDLYKECGSDITDCEAASICLPNDRRCSVTYCNSEIESNVCSALSTESNVQNNNQDSTLDETLQDNNINDANI